MGIESKKQKQGQIMTEQKNKINGKLFTQKKKKKKKKTTQDKNASKIRRENERRNINNKKV